jgi:hypothetical protein
VGLRKTKENSGEPVSRPKLEPGTFRIRIRSAKHSALIFGTHTSKNIFHLEPLHAVWICTYKLHKPTAFACVSNKQLMAIFWVEAPCSLVDVYQRFRDPCYLHHPGDKYPDDGGSKALWNVGKLLPDYTALQPRRQPSSYSPPWEPQIPNKQC